MNSTLTRRRWLHLSAAGLGAAATTSAAAQSIAQACSPTPRQAEGPFYPVTTADDEDWDLTQVHGQRNRAEGTPLYVRGIVTDENCRPVPGALVEIWQAGENGRYHHPGDAENPRPLDPDFQYWGQVVTDATGAYLFRTLKPGAYPASGNWVRPSHIHFKVSRRGYHELITQLYFEGDPYLDEDRILQALNADERSQVVRSITHNENEQRVVDFPISLRQVP